MLGQRGSDGIGRGELVVGVGVLAPLTLRWDGVEKVGLPQSRTVHIVDESAGADKRDLRPV